MVSVTIQLDDALASQLQQLADEQSRSREDLLLEAAAYLASGSARPLPKGMGAYRSGCTNVSSDARQILRGAVRSGEWP